MELALGWHPLSPLRIGSRSSSIYCKEPFRFNNYYFFVTSVIGNTNVTVVLVSIFGERTASGHISNNMQCKYVWRTYMLCLSVCAWILNDYTVSKLLHICVNVPCSKTLNFLCLCKLDSKIFQDHIMMTLRGTALLGRAALRRTTSRLALAPIHPS